eukprot:17864-Heterococcus_DN1.PRE.3
MAHSSKCNLSSSTGFFTLFYGYYYTSQHSVRVKPDTVVLIGDHHQLPPVVKCQALQKHAHLDQSLFARFIRLGTPSVQLDAQGRARPALAALYSWRYKNLGNLPSRGNSNRDAGGTAVTARSSAHSLANAGFARPFQLINVEDFQGHGETAPTAHFYQHSQQELWLSATSSLTVVASTSST